MSWTVPSGDWCLAGALVPAAMVQGLAGVAAGDGLMWLDLGLVGGRFAVAAPGLPRIEAAGRIVLPGLVDGHTHLDKGHIWPRTPNPDGSFPAALAAAGADRAARWTGEDVARRMDFALRAAHAHGTVAVRTHLDSVDARAASSWDAFAAAREAWAGRIALQAAALTVLEGVDTPAYAAIADLVAGHGGVMGAVVWGPGAPQSGALGRFFELAGSRGLDADFHADENLEPTSDSLRAIADAVLETGYAGRVAVGHACSLAVQPEAEALTTLDRVAEAGIALISLPLCNQYLQDRVPGRTPRLRGVTLVHEARARGIPVAFASDNTRDPFYAYGDLDMLEVWREAVRIAHLDHPVGAWPAAFGPVPAAIMGVEAGLIAPGRPADLILTGARDWTALHARPQADRVVLRGGRVLDAAPPDHAELDDIMG
ncbi:MAG: cytosine deaminase [Pseudomonadota bacterium]